MVIHQVWIGPKTMPTQWMDTWRKLNPDMEYSLWTNYQGFHYQKKIQHFVDQGKYACAVDIMRVEILHEHGGVYIDADSIALLPIQDAPFINDEFFACQDYTPWVANGVIGCTPKHPIITKYFERIAGPHEYWEYGARMLSDCMNNRATILPTCSFYPTNYNGQKAPLDGPVYAEQVWATTRGKYA